MKHCIGCSRSKLTIRKLQNDNNELAYLLDQKIICRSALLICSLLLNVFLIAALWGAA